MTWFYRATGAAGNGSNAASLTPGMPAGWQPNDLLVLQVQTFGGTNGRVPVLPSGWTAFTGDAVWANGTSQHMFCWRRARPDDTAPTISMSGSGAASDTQVSQIHAFWSSLGDFAVDQVGAESTNASADNIGPITGITAVATTLGLITAGKANDFNGNGSLTNWVQAALAESTTGNDAGVTLMYRLSMPGGATGNLTVTDDGGTASAGVGQGQMVSFSEVQAVYDEADNGTAWALVGARTVLASALAVSAFMGQVQRDVTAMGAAQDEVPTAAPLPGGGAGTVRPLILNAGWKQPRRPIAVEDDLPIAATLAHEEVGPPPMVPWPAWARTPVVLDDPVLSIAAAPIVFEDDGFTARILWPTPKPAPVVTDTDERPTPPAFVPDDDYEPVRIAVVPEFTVPHPSGYGAADEEVTTMPPEPDAYFAPAPWKWWAPYRLAQVDPDVYPTAPAALNVEEEAAAVLAKPWPWHAPYRLPQVDPDHVPAGPTPLPVDEEFQVRLIRWGEWTSWIPVFRTTVVSDDTSELLPIEVPVVPGLFNYPRYRRARR